MSEISELPFQTLIDILLDEETPLNPRYLYRLSDLDGEELALFIEAWPRVPLWRRQALMEDLEELGNSDDLLSFEEIGRHGILDDDPKIRQLAVQILWEFDSRDLIPTFLQLVKSDPGAEVRAAAASGLGRFVYMGELDQVPKEDKNYLEERLLQVILEDPSSLVRRRALESISFSSRSEVAKFIELAYESDDKESMTSALIAMGRSMDSRWERIILTMLIDKVPTLRAEAARAAGELEITEAIPILIELTDDSEEKVRSAAIWSLSQIGGNRARQTLENLFIEAVDDPEADFLESALDNLAFTNGLPPFSLLDFPENSPEDELIDLIMAEEVVWEVEDNGNSEDNGDLMDDDILGIDDFNDEDKDFQD